MIATVSWGVACRSRPSTLGRTVAAALGNAGQPEVSRRAGSRRAVEAFLRGLVEAVEDRGGVSQEHLPGRREAQPAP